MTECLRVNHLLQAFSNGNCIQYDWRHAVVHAGFLLMFVDALQLQRLLQQEAFEKCWAIRRRTPPVLILHCHSPGVATVDTTTKMSRSQL